MWNIKREWDDYETRFSHMKQMSDKFNTGISITPCDIGVSGVVTLYHYFLMYIKLKEMMRK